MEAAVRAAANGSAAAAAPTPEGLLAATANGLDGLDSPASDSAPSAPAPPLFTPFAAAAASSDGIGSVA